MGGWAVEWMSEWVGAWMVDWMCEWVVGGRVGGWVGKWVGKWVAHLSSLPPAHCMSVIGLPVCVCLYVCMCVSRGLTAEVLPDYERNLAKLLRQPSTANFSKEECEEVLGQAQALGGEVTKLQRLVQPLEAAQADLEKSQQRIAELSPAVSTQVLFVHYLKHAGFQAALHAAFHATFDCDARLICEFVCFFSSPLWSFSCFCACHLLLLTSSLVSHYHHHHHHHHHHQVTSV